MSIPRLRRGGWVLIADGEKALFLENAGTPDKPDLTVFREFQQENPATADQGSDRPGRLSDGGPDHKSAVEETDWHRIAKERFAGEIAAKLDGYAAANRFEQLVLVAPPLVLGELRKNLGKQAASRIIQEVAKDFTKHPVARIQKLVLDA